MKHLAINQPPGKAFPDEQDYHGHPNYGRVFFSLLFFLGISLVAGYIFSSPALAITLIFITAGVKTMLVVRNFMHLKFEPLLIWVVILVVVFILVSFFFGVFPDIVPINLDVVK